MTSSPKLNLDKSTGSHPTKLENGSPALDSGKMGNQARTPSGTDSLNRLHQPNLERIFGFGKQRKRPASLMRCAIPEQPFLIRNNGSIGLEILDADGNVIAWTTDPVIAELICRLLTEFDERVGIPTLN